MEQQAFSELVARARHGDKGSMEQLARLAAPRLRSYVYRITLNDELTDDLVQETLYQMVASIQDLRKVESFWGWLFRIAFTKAKEFFRRRSRRREVQLSVLDGVPNERIFKDRPDSISERLYHNELGQLVLQAVDKLPIQQRSIVSLRCFEDMQYSQIARIVGCTETHARVSFFRARQLLKRHLRRNGVSKGAFMAALTVFGKLTAQSEAAAATTTVGAATLGGVGIRATLLGTAKLPAIIAAIAAVVVLIGSFAWRASVSEAVPDAALARSDVRFVRFIRQGVRVQSVTAPSGSSSSDQSELVGERRAVRSMGAYETWMHFPDGPDGPLIRRDQRWLLDMSQKLCSWLQDGNANYYYHSGEKTIYMHNAPLSALVLPTDSAEFCEFIREQYGDHPDIEHARDESNGLLLGSIDNRVPDVKDYKTLYEYNTLDTDVFQRYWPEGTPVVDQRDRMHKRGWTYFTVSGRIGDQVVSGSGRVPFVYAAFAKHTPWLELRIGNEHRVIDCASGAILINRAGKVLAAYPAGSFFKGLGRPWMGIRAFDSVRRDAAEKRIPFRSWSEGEEAADGKHTHVVALKRGEDELCTRILYRIDMNRDVIDSMEFEIPEGIRLIQGQIEFTYLDKVDGLADRFAEPELKSFTKVPKSQSPTVMWLCDLASGKLTR